MNEQIRELAEQAGFENGHQDRNGNSLSCELEKFAELIVRECARVANENVGAFTPSCGNFVMDHFGVEREWNDEQSIT